MQRRDALKLIGVSLIATMTGCGKKILSLEDDVDSAYDLIREAEDERVRQLLKKYGANHSAVFNVAFITDSHIDLGSNVVENYQNVRDTIRFCGDSDIPISAIIQGGDIVTKRFGRKEQHIEHMSEYFDMSWKSQVPHLYTKGNHDLNAINVSPSDLLSDKDWGKVWFDKAESSYGIVRNKKANGQKSGYYYYDLNTMKVRIISIDCFDVDYSKTDSEGNILYWGGTSNYIANEQFNWIVHSALNFDDKEEKDWGVILFTHFYRPSDKNGTSIEPVFESIFKKFNDMLLAFNKQSAFALNYSFPENDFYDLSVQGDWSRYAEEDKKPYLICILSGHQHKDIYMNWWGTKHIVTANQFCGMQYSDERIKRTPSSRSQNLFDILNIDLKERKMRVFRYGASANLDGQEGNRFLSDGGLSF